MNQTIIRTLSIAVLAAFGAMNAGAQQKVEITNAGSSGIQPAKVTVGSKTNATVLVAIRDASGVPVEGEAANLAMVNFVIPVGAACGMTQQGVSEVKPGIYQITLAMPALPQCVWSNGDYMAIVRLGTAAYFGMTPFLVGVR